MINLRNIFPTDFSSHLIWRRKKINFVWIARAHLGPRDLAVAWCPFMIGGYFWKHWKGYQQHNCLLSMQVRNYENFIAVAYARGYYSLITFDKNLMIFYQRITFPENNTSALNIVHLESSNQFVISSTFIFFFFFIKFKG